MGLGDATLLWQRCCRSLFEFTGAEFNMTLTPETLTAYATLALACVTVAAIVVPVIQRNRERIREQQAALRQLRFVLLIYQRRLNELAHDNRWKADILLNGLDTMMTAILSTNVAKLVPQSTAMSEAYLALVDAHNTLVFAIQQQEHNDPRVQDEAKRVILKLKAAGHDVFLERAKYDLKAMRLFPNWFTHIDVMKASSLDEDTGTADG